MSEIEDKINQILQNPEAMRQVQSLGEQLGLTPKPEPPKPAITVPSLDVGNDMLGAITKLAPMLKSLKNDDDTTRLLEALRPFLGDEKRRRLEQAEKMIKFIKIIPLLKENGIFF